MKVMLKNVRLAFPKIWEPEQFNGQGEAACSAALIIDPDVNKETMTAVAEAIKKTAEEKWGAKSVDMIKSLKAKGDVCFRSGEDKSEYDGFEGKWYVSARSKARPLVLDRNKSPLTEADGRPYAGCYCDVLVDIWAQENGYGKRINAKLLGVRFMAHGESFGGGGSASADDFDDVEGESSSNTDDLF